MNKESDPVPSTHQRGQCAERLARHYLESRDYRWMESNFRWRGGEIDLVMRAPDGALVFVEVRSAAQASPWLRHTISRGKRRRLWLTAQEYAFRRPWARRLARRFDLLWIEDGHVDHWTNVLLT